MSQIEQLDRDERNRLDDELARALERLDLLVEATLDGIYDWDLIAGVDWHSPRLKRLLDYSDAEMPDDIKVWEGLIHPDDQDRVAAALDAHFERGAPYAVDYRMRTKSGSYRWFYDQGHAIRDSEGRPVRMVGSMHDITDRVEAEAARTRLGRIIENSLNELYVVDAESLRFIEVNAGGLANLQYSAEEMREMTPAEIVPGYTQDDMRVLLTSLREGDKPSVSLESRHQRKDGSIYDVAVHLQYMGEEQPPVYIAFIEDISERNQADDELREVHERLSASEQLFRSMTENQPGAVYRSRPDEPWTDIYFSDGIEELTGYPASDFVENGVRRIADIVHPDDVDIYYASTIAKEPNTQEYRIIHRDGSVRWIEDRNRGVYDDDGVIRWIDGILFDVTGQKEMAAALAASEEQFRTMVDNMPGAAYRSRPDEHWTNVYLSERIEEITGYPADDFIDAKARRFIDIVHPDDREIFLHSAVSGESRPEEYRIIHRDGGVRWIQDRYRGLHDGKGNLLWVDGVMFDVTAQKDAEAALAESEDHLSTLAAHVPGAMYRSLPDEHWTDVYMSDGIEELTGYPASDFINGKVRHLGDLCHPDDRDSFYDSEITRETHIDEYRIIHRDGGVRWLQDRNRGVYDDDGSCRWIDGVLFDVTAQKEAEAALAASENQFRTMVDNMPGAIYRCLPDEHWTDVYLSDAVEQLTGYSASELLRPGGQKFEEIIHPDDLEEYMNAGIDPADDPYITEYRIFHADGSIRWLHDRSRIITDEAGSAEWVDGVLIDVTARHEAQDALAEATRQREESEAQFRLMVANVPGAIYRCRPAADWPFHHISEGIEELTGYPASEFIANRELFSSLIVGADLRPIDDVLGPIKSGKQVESEYRILRADGSERWVLERSKGVFDARGELVWLDGAIIDISARKDAEAAARASREQFAGIVGNLPGAVYRSKADGWGMAFISERIEDLTGRAPAFFLDGGPEAFRTVTHPDDLESVEAGIGLSIETGVPYDNEYRFCHTDGSVIWVHETAHVLRGPDGQFLCMDGVIMDITAKKRAEEAAHEIEQQFATMVENIPGAVYRTGADGWTVEYMSEPIRELTGRAPDYFTGYGPDALASVAHSDDLPSAYEKISRSMATGVPYEHEYRMIHVDGSIRWVHEIAHAVRGADGAFLWLDGVIFDITEKKEADEQLRRSETSLANAQRIAGLGSWEWDLAAETLWWAEGTYPLFGFDPGKTTPSYELFLRHVHPDDRAAMDRAVERALATGKPYTLDFRFVRPDGELRIFQDNAEPVLDTTGKAVTLLGSVQDITERKQAEERLRRSESSLANAQRIAHVGSWEWDVAGGKLYWSDEIYRIFGQDPETFDLSLDEYYAAVHPDDRAWLRAAVEKGIASGEPFSGDHRIVRRDGEVRVIHEESEVTRVRDGATARVSGTIQDVTEQRQAEEQLRRSEASLANAQRIAHIGNWDWDLVRKEARWSDEVYRIAGLDPSGEPMTEEIVRAMIHPDDLDRLERQEGKAAERREPYSIDYRMIRPDGQMRTVHETCEPTINDAGEVVRLSGTVQDFTERRHAEEELRRSEASLANAQRIARIGNWDWDPVNDDWYWSDEIFRMLGRERESSAMSLEDFYAAVHPDDVENLRAAVDDSVRQGAGYQLDFRVVRPDGDITVVSEQVEVVRDAAGRILRISGIDQDITERRRAEQELRETLERLDLVTNATVDCIYDWDPVSDSLWHSSRMKDLLGYEVAEVRDHPNAWLTRLHPDDLDLLSGALARHFETREPFELEYRVKAKDGRYVWLQDRGQAVWDESGEAVRMVGALHDVTERKLAEERLRASEEQLRVITDNIPLLIGYIDRDERYRFANKAQEDWYGKPIEEIVGKTLREVMGEASYREVKPKVDRVLMGDRVDTEDVYQQSGGRRVVHSTRVPHFAEDGSVLGYFVVVEDITERKRVEEALRASEEQLRVITDNVPAVIVYVDRDERFRFANRAQSEWLGYPAAKTIGKTMREVLDEAYYAEVKPEIDKVLSGRASTQELVVDHPVKGEVVLNTTRIPHFAEDGSVLGYFAVVEDITERKHSEQALRDNEAQLRLVTNNVPAMIVYVDRDETIQFVNRAREMWSEQPAGELIGRSVREVVAPESYEANRAQIVEVLRGKPNGGEHAVEHPRFGRRVLQTTRVPNFDDRGEVVGYLAVIEDITERKSLEEELRHTQKMEAVGQLAGGISHEVNNMLTPIVGLTEMTLHSLPEDSKSRPNLEMVLTASHRVEELVKRILAFSRADTEEMVEFDLSDVVAEAIPLLKATVPATIQVDAEIAEGIGPVFGNPTAVQQVLMNLATNAAYAMEPEGGRFTVVLDRVSKRDGSRLRRLLGARDGIARLTVQDTGCGMSQEVLDRVFEPFYTTREVGSGTGLGLSVVHGIVTKLGGRIEVESVQDEGTKFVIHIPLVGKSGGAGAATRR